MNTRYLPLLSDSPLRPRAEAILESLTSTLRPAALLDPATNVYGVTPHSSIASPNLASGMSGLGLLFAHRYAFTRAEQDLDDMIACFERAMELLSDVGSMPSLFSGYSGVAWAIEAAAGMLQRECGVSLFDADAGDINEDIDAALIDLLEDEALSHDCELIMGLAGLGVYFLERGVRPSARHGLALVEGHLVRTAQKIGPGLAWLKPEASISPLVRPQRPNGEINLGLSHGIPGALVFLARLEQARAASSEAREVLRRGMELLLSTGQNDLYGNALDPVTLEVYARMPRTAWCYGTLGVATALLHAGLAAEEPAWAEAGTRAASVAASWRGDIAGVKDACVCHGAAGNALLFARLFQATGDDGLRNAALFWYEETLNLYDPQVNGPSGYVFSQPDVRAIQEGQTIFDAPIAMLPSDGVLEGTCGVALALLSALSPAEPVWDRMFLSDLPSR